MMRCTYQSILESYVVRVIRIVELAHIAVVGIEILNSLVPKARPSKQSQC